MKKVLMVGLALLVSAAFVTAVFAQAPAKPAEKPAAAAPEKAPAPAPEKKAPAPEKKAAAPAEKKADKPKVHQYTGEVVKMDAGKMIVLKGKQGEKSFDLAPSAKMKGEPKEGDKVVVKYTEKDGKMVASSVTKSAAEKKPAEKKPAEKKPAEAAKPAPEKAPAPAPAPAKPAEPAKK